jgi:hypothetical protein
MMKLLDADQDGKTINESQDYGRSDDMGEFLKAVDKGVNKCIGTEEEQSDVSFAFVIVMEYCARMVYFNTFFLNSCVICRMSLSAMGLLEISLMNCGEIQLLTSNL